MLNRDADGTTVAGAVQEGTSIVAPFKVDPVTGRLLIVITPIASTVPASTAKDSRFDENRTNTGTVVDDNGNLCPLLIDDATGYLMCDVVIE